MSCALLTPVSLCSSIGEETAFSLLHVCLPGRAPTSPSLQNQLEEETVLVHLLWLSRAPEVWLTYKGVLEVGHSKRTSTDFTLMKGGARTYVQKRGDVSGHLALSQSTFKQLSHPLGPSLNPKRTVVLNIRAQVSV